MSVHMFGLRVRIEEAHRSKNGHAPQRTTGSERTSWIQLRVDAGTFGNSRCPSIAMTTISAVSGSVHQNRRRKSTSSGFSSSSATGISGSSAIPHFGHTPGPTCRTSGCIGQV